jgi:hypothetical protein
MWGRGGRARTGRMRGVRADRVSAHGCVGTRRHYVDARNHSVREHGVGVREQGVDASMRGARALDTVRAQACLGHTPVGARMSGARALDTVSALADMDARKRSVRESLCGVQNDTVWRAGRVGARTCGLKHVWALACVGARMCGVHADTVGALASVGARGHGGGASRWDDTVGKHESVARGCGAVDLQPASPPGGPAHSRWQRAGACGRPRRIAQSGPERCRVRTLAPTPGSRCGNARRGDPPRRRAPCRRGCGTGPPCPRRGSPLR